MDVNLLRSNFNIKYFMIIFSSYSSNYMSKNEDILIARHKITKYKTQTLVLSFISFILIAIYTFGFLKFLKEKRTNIKLNVIVDLIIEFLGPIFNYISQGIIFFLSFLFFLTSLIINVLFDNHFELTAFASVFSLCLGLIHGVIRFIFKSVDSIISCGAIFFFAISPLFFFIITLFRLPINIEEAEQNSRDYSIKKLY